MLSPVDIQNKEFRKNKIGGYNIEEVNDFLDEVLKSYQEVINENYALKDKINALNESVQYYRTMESTIQNVLVLADKTAQDTKSAAYEKAEEIRKEAEQRAEKMTGLAEERVTRIVEQGRQEAFELSQKVEEIKRQYLSYKSQFKQLLQSQMELLEQGEVRATLAQDELVQAFASIEKDTVESVEANTDQQVEESYFTKEYIPVSEEELSSLLNK